MGGSKSTESRVVPGRHVVLELDYDATWDHHGDHWHGSKLLELHLMFSKPLERMLYNDVRRTGSGRLLMQLKNGEKEQSTASVDNSIIIYYPLYTPHKYSIFLYFVNITQILTYFTL